MQNIPLIAGNNEEEIWQQINKDLNKDEDIWQYQAAIEQGGQKIFLNIDIDPGGGFESGYSTTTFTAPLLASDDFNFAIHEEHFTDDIGKFFGMQDVVIGYPSFDDRFIIKTNNAAKAKAVFSNADVRETLLQLSPFTFAIMHHDADNNQAPSFLELNIEDGITDTKALRKIYHAFYLVLQVLNEVHK